MKYFHYHLALHLIGFSSLSSIEIFRPGTVTGAISIGWVLFLSALLLTAHYRLVIAPTTNGAAPQPPDHTPTAPR